ncbi:hypothetical protein SGRA_1674 [Saprospira grandis str. Lewin]|uniref:Uncharacterized protein n=1 Tax=Saprospira grandis (strain Lewin) TaxID=984262 RepID=H6LAC4_SAPGL|nr:hypothetical protein SGRA_1674 [Saprospira grandis str. Lewin]
MIHPSGVFPEGFFLAPAASSKGRRPAGNSQI